jgi:hypothetical protein
MFELKFQFHICNKIKRTRSYFVVRTTRHALLERRRRRAGPPASQSHATTLCLLRKLPSPGSALSCRTIHTCLAWPHDTAYFISFRYNNVQGVCYRELGGDRAPAPCWFSANYQSPFLSTQKISNDTGNIPVLNLQFIIHWFS